MFRGVSFFIPILLFSGVNPESKKAQLLELSKKYFPENYAVLKAYSESDINRLAKGDSLTEFISGVATIVHEGYHHYQGVHSSYYDSNVIFRINDTLSFSVRNFKTFPARQINQLVPDAVRKKIFRYDTYISSKEKYLVTQQFGILGLLEECIAYYQSLHTDISLFNFYRDRYGWKNPDAWTGYLSDMASFRYAITEFKLFISWYMQLARNKYPAIYRDITANTGLKKLFVFIEREDRRLAKLYDEQREIILRQLGDKLEIRGNFIFNTANLRGKGLYDYEVAAMLALLKKPEHRILDELRK